MLWLKRSSNTEGNEEFNPMTGAVISSLVQVVLLLVFVIFRPPKTFNWIAFFYFVASGLLASTFGRFLNYVSIERLGVSLSASIIGSSPLFSTIFAVLFIGEELFFSTLIGTVLVVSGIAITRNSGDFEIRLKDALIFLPIASAAFYGASSVVRKIGLNLLPESSLGAFIGAGASLVSFIFYLVTTQRLREIKLDLESVRYFLASGIMVTIGWLSMFTALSVGKVSVVSALIGTNPLFSYLLSFIFLKDTESFDFGIVLGCLSIIAGTVVITLF